MVYESLTFRAASVMLRALLIRDLLSYGLCLHNGRVWEDC